MPYTAENHDEDLLVDTHEAARLFGLKEGTLRKQRVYGGGCPFHKLNRSVRYSMRDIVRHKAMNRVANTSEHWAAR